MRRGIASGAAWMISFRMADRFIGLLSTTLLARILSPDDFGLMALAMSMIAVLDMLGELSFDLALIRDQEATEEHYHTAWSARLAKGLLLCAVLNVAAAPAALFFGDSRLQPVVRVLSLSVVLSSLQSIRLTDLRKELAFRKEFNFRIVSRLFGFITTLALAWLWRDYWALVYGMIATSALRFLMSYIMMPYWPKLTLSRFHEIFDFSKWLLAENLFTALTRRSPSLVIGRAADTQILGIYTISNQICSMASTELVAPIKRALFPGYSKLVSDFQSLRQVYLENFSVIVLLAMPIAAGIGLTAEFLVPIFFGSKWTGAIPVMEILSIHAILRTINTNSRPLYLATNRPRLSFFLTVANVVVLLPALSFAVPLGGAVGAAAAVVCAGAAVTLLDSLIVVRLLGVSWVRFLSSIWRTVVSVAVMWIGITEVKAAMHGADFSSNIGQLVICVLLGAGIYVGTHLLLWRISGSPKGSETLLLRWARNRGRRMTSRSVVASTE